MFYCKSNFSIKKILAVTSIIFVLQGCSDKAEQPILKLKTAEEHIKYIIEEYNFDNDSEYITKYVNNKFATNEFLIDSLADNYSVLEKIEDIKDNVYKVHVDGEVLEITMDIKNEKIDKIKVKATVENE